MKQTIRFSAKLIRPSMTVVVPKGAKLPADEKIAIEGVIASIPLQTHAEPDRNGGSAIKINGVLVKILEKNAEETVSVEIMKVGDEPETRVPADLAKALAGSAKATATWQDITPIARRDWIYWMSTAKQEKTRGVRIDKMIDMLSSGKRRVCCFGGINWLMKGK